MTRASTCAANFGLLLVALVLMLHSVVGKLIPRHVSHLFAREDSIDQCFLTKLVPNEVEYKKRCEGEDHPYHPCFTHWSGDLTAVDARPFLEPFDITKELMIKDNEMKDAFLIRYPNLGGVHLVYSNFDPKTGCKDITLKRDDNSVWRIWVSDEDGNGRDIDTKNHAETTKTLCSKWIHIHIKKDG
ncbi:related to Mig1 protein, induced during biotrophic phase [Ustilago bromivora]|uniref:Related to Mig1 protein, induced during biotrophic phase n=1 Tax=Ustilago bromivora TaxID=307758 RepID=A0A1K0HKL4_9BASI|nr:related to Mig1 protein, induced during biotrophic phase [Ustilago bromivora]